MDGGASAQVFVYPPWLAPARLRIKRHAGAPRLRHPQRASRSGLGQGRAEHAQHHEPRSHFADPDPRGRRPLPDLSRAERDGVDFNLAYIPETFTTQLNEPFETAYMSELFRRRLRARGQRISLGQGPAGLHGAADRTASGNAARGNPTGRPVGARKVVTNPGASIAWWYEGWHSS